MGLTQGEKLHFNFDFRPAVRRAAAVGRVILTFLAFGRKISYICNSEGAGRVGLPLFCRYFGSIVGKNSRIFGKKVLIPVEKASNGIAQSNTWFLKKVTSELKNTTRNAKTACSKSCRRLKTLKSALRFREPDASLTGAVVLPVFLSVWDR